MKPTDCTEGKKVIYWPLKSELGHLTGRPLATEIRHAAYEVNGLWVCFIKGKAGYVLCEHLEELTDKYTARNFQALEIKGELPYVLMWIGAHHMPSAELLPTLGVALDRYRYLKGIGCRPTLMLNLIMNDELPAL